MTTENVFVPGMGEISDMYENSVVSGLFALGHHLAGDAILTALDNVNKELADGVDVVTAVGHLKGAIIRVVEPAVDRWLEVAVRFNEELSCR